MIGIVEIPFSVLLLAGMILSFIHYVLGFIVIIFAIIFFLVQFHQGILAISTTNKTQTIYTIALCVGIAIIAFILAFFVVILCAIIAFSIGAYQDAQTAIQSSQRGTLNAQLCRHPAFGRKGVSRPKYLAGANGDGQRIRTGHNPVFPGFQISRCGKYHARG